jgi:lipopolysaccharide transport system ATP-binding protein
VLAVGDAAFQKKCLGKMGDVSKEGRTVLFVSHDMGAIQTLCPRVLWIDRGDIRGDDNAAKIVESYLNQSGSGTDTKSFLKVHASRSIQIKAIRLLNSVGLPSDVVPVGDPVVFELEFTAGETLNNPFFVFTIRDQTGTPVSTINSFESLGSAPAIREGGRVRVCVNSLPLIPGTYNCDMLIYLYGEQIAACENCLVWNVVPSSFYVTGKFPGKNMGVVCLQCEWDLAYT